MIGVHSLFCVFLCVFAISATSSHSSWSTCDASIAPRTAELRFTIAVKQRNVNLLSSLVSSISDPLSPQYGQYLSLDEINELLVSTRDNKRVIQWLIDQGVPSHAIHSDGGFIDVTLSAELASTVFSSSNDDEPTPLYSWRCADHATRERTTIIRANISSHDLASGRWKHILLPPRVRNSIDVITGLYDRYPPSHRRASAPPPPSRHWNVGTQSNAPNLMGVLASDTTIYTQFQPVCKDGSPAGPDMCNDNPPSISSFELLQTRPDGKLLSKTSMGCGNAIPSTLQPAHRKLRRGGISCQSSASSAGPFLLVNVSLRTLYSDGTLSDPAGGGGAILTTPFVDTKLANIFYALPMNNSIGERFAAWPQSAVEFSHNFFSMQDLDAFFQYNQLNPDVKVSVHGPNDQNDPEGEADQDMQWIMGTGVQVDTVFWSTKDSNGFVLDWQKGVAQTPDDQVPYVYSISYGQPEALMPPMFGSGYMERSEEEFIKMAARGMSVVVADGDSGSSNGLGCSDEHLYPDWPASSPHVTSAGGTTISSYHLPSTAVAVGTRTGVAYTTGGGFSSIFPRPLYQDNAVKKYLESHNSSLPLKRMYNSSNRVFPDVGVLGYNLLTFYYGQNWINPFPGGGTSFSAPIMAGMISRWNVMRYSNGHPRMGLINPWLYHVHAQDPAAFYDVIVGDNACVGDGQPCCTYGYHCVEGYDAVSGLGSPYFDKLTKHVNEMFPSE